MQRTAATKAVHDFFCDSHCHLREAALRGTEGKASASPSSSSSGLAEVRLSVAALVLCGTHPQVDWDLVARATTSTTTCVNRIAGFGVHPWFVPAVHDQRHISDEGDAASVAPAQPDQKAKERGGGKGCCGASDGAPADLSLSVPEMLTDLERRLRTFPRAIVAEIGLDKLRGPPELIQKEAFIAQLRIAAAYQRPVSVHCVRQYGLVMQILQDLPAEDTPPAIILHAFTGSTEVAKSLLNLKNKKRRQPEAAAAVEPAETVPKEAPTTSDSTTGTFGSATAEAPAPPSTKKTKRGGGKSADTVRIKERIFFGVGFSTSFTVKNFSTHTLPLLLNAQRLLLETDAHYSAAHDQGSDGDAAGCAADACVHVDEQEHAGQLSEVMRAVEAAAVQSAEFAKTAQVSGVAPGVMARQSIAAAYAHAFGSVLN